MVQFNKIEVAFYSPDGIDNRVTFTAGNNGLLQTFTASFFTEGSIALLNFDSINTGGRYVVMSPQQRADLGIQASTALTIYLNR